MRVTVDGEELDMVIADDVDGDAMDLEFRTDPLQKKPTIIVAQHGDPADQDLRVLAFEDVRLDRLRNIVCFARQQHGAADTSVREPRGIAISRPNGERAGVLDFHDSHAGELLASSWVVDSPSGPVVWARVWQEIDLATFDAVVADSERRLPGAAGAGAS